MLASRPIHHARLRDDRPERQPRGDAFCDADDVGHDAPMLARKHFSRASHAGLHFVGDEQYTMPVAEPTQRAEKTIFGHDYAAFTLNRLDENARDYSFKKRLIEELQPAQRIRHVRDAGKQRTEAFFVDRLAVAERERAGGAPVECAVKRDQMRALRVPAREFDCRLDGLRAGVAQKYARVAATREQPREPLRKLGAERMVKIGEREMQQPMRLFFDRLRDLRMQTARRVDSDPRGEIEEEIAINIADPAAGALLGNNRIEPGHGLAHEFLIKRQNLSRLRAWKRRGNFGVPHAQSSNSLTKHSAQSPSAPVDKALPRPPHHSFRRYQGNLRQ